jgi:hypothetical protein
VGGSGASATVGSLGVGGVRRKVARGIIGLVGVARLLVGHRFAGWRSLVNGHAELGGHVGRTAGNYPMQYLAYDRRGRGRLMGEKICSTSGRKSRLTARRGDHCVWVLSRRSLWSTKTCSATCDARLTG